MLKESRLLGVLNDLTGWGTILNGGLEFPTASRTYANPLKSCSPPGIPLKPAHSLVASTVLTVLTSSTPDVPSPRVRLMKIQRHTASLSLASALPCLRVGRSNAEDLAHSLAGSMDDFPARRKLRSVPRQLGRSVSCLLSPLTHQD